MAAIVSDQSDFKTKLQDAGDKLVIIDFFATWCGPCKMIAPKLEELANEMSSQIVVLKVDVDECEELAIEYNITSMPTFIFIKNGKQVENFSGANYDRIKETIQKHL